MDGDQKFVTEMYFQKNSEMPPEVKPDARLNGLVISLPKSDKEIVDSFLSVLVHMSQASLRDADEHLACLFLKTLIHSGIRNTEWYFLSCKLDEKFFELLGSDDWLDLQVIGFIDCQVNLSENTPVEVITESFSNLGLITEVCLGAPIVAKRQGDWNPVPIEVYRQPAAKKDCPPCATSSIFSPTQEQYPKSFPCVDAKRMPGGAKAIIESSLFMLISKAPNVQCSFIKKNCPQDFVNRAFDEFCRRPPNSVPSKFHYLGPELLNSYSIATKTLQYFNIANMTALSLKMGYKEATDMEGFLTRALEVISESVHLKELTVYIDNETELDRLFFFLKHLRILAPRLPPFQYHEMYGLYSRARVNMNLANEIKLISQRKISTKGGFCNIFVMVAAITLPETRVYSKTCMLRMLSKNLLRLLRDFICDESLTLSDLSRF